MDEAVVKEIACPSCGKPVKVRVIATASEHRFHCPHCKNIVTAKT